MTNSKPGTPQSAITDQGVVTEFPEQRRYHMLPKRNPFCNIKTPAGSVQSLAARRYQQASHPPITGKRFRSEYHGCQSYSIKFCIVRGFLILHGRKLDIALGEVRA